MASAVLRGIVPAVVTPFRENEAIDYGAWQKVLEWLIGCGVHGLFVLGGPGEFFALSEEERAVAARFCAQTVSRRLPLFVNVGAVTTRETVRLAQQAEQDGVDHLVVITPYYLKPSADELFEHYAEVCRSVRRPVLASSLPKHAGATLSPAVLSRVAEAHENFAGLMDSSGRLELIPECKRAGLTVFIGRDDMVLDGLRMGCAGAVSACASVVPRALVDLFEAYQAGNLEEAARVQALVETLREAFSLATFPSAVKEAMNMCGVDAGRCRRPIGIPPEEARIKLAGVLERLREARYVPGFADRASGGR